MSALRVLVKNLVKESFDITFMENEKNYQNINCFFSFSIKIFFNITPYNTFSMVVIKN